MSQFPLSGWSFSKLVFRFSATIVVAAGLCTPAWSALGEARLQSSLGQQLRAQIPTVGLSLDELEPKCLRLFRPSSNAGVPVPQDIYLEFQDFGSSRRVTVRTRSAVQEPAIRFGVELTCGQSVKREYILLLDPQPVGDTAALPNSPLIEGSPIGEPSVVVGRPTTRNANAGAESVGNGAPAVTRPVARKRPTALAQGSAEAPPRRTREAAAKLSIRGGADSLTRDLDLTAFASPRLRLSQSLTLGGVGLPTTTDVDRAVMASKRSRMLATPIEADLRPQLEVDLMIAQKRIGELQARLAAADPNAAATIAATPTPSVAAGEPVKVPAAMTAPLVEPAPAPAPQTPIAPKVISREKQAVESSNLLPLVAGLAGLGALALTGALLWLRKKRKAEEQERAYAAAAAAVGLSPDIETDQAMGGFVDTRMRGMTGRNGTRPGKRSTKKDDGDTVRDVVASVENATGEVVRSSDGGSLTTVRVHGSNELGPLDLTSDLFQPNFDTDQLGVSLVSAITEEASVYVELNRIPEAIAVLRDHVDLERAYNRATPAPWLMLLDMYHREDNRPEFDKLRSEFMKNFNGRIPEWGAFAEAGNDKSLLEHEHIVERLVRYWASPQCHQYVQKLLYDHRDNSRMGFSLMAYRELVMLDAIHNMAFPLPDADAPIEIPDVPQFS